jgi:hypothetical protein
MKKIMLSLLLMGCVAVVTVISCKKVQSNPTTVVNTTQSLNQLFAGLRYTPQGLSVQAGRDTVVFGTNGTMLHFYTNSFMDINHNVLTSGIVNLQLIELYKPVDYICNRTATIANNSLLNSAGEISLTGTMNGQVVYASKYGVGFVQTSASSDTMQLYYGNTNNADSVTTWTSGSNTTGSIAAKTDTFDTGWPYYMFDSCTGLGQVNCDYFYNTSGFSSQSTDITVIMPNANFNSHNTQILFIYRPKNWSIPVTLYDSTANSFSLNYHGTQVPVGVNYELVAITNNNGSWYYYQTSGTTTSGTTINAAMGADTKADIQTRLGGL